VPPQLCLKTIVQEKSHRLNVHFTSRDWLIYYAKQDEETMEELEVHDREIQKEGLRMLVELARDSEPEDDYTYDKDEE